MGLIRVPNFWLWAVRLAAWVLWREPVARPDTNARPPRKQVICFSITPMPSELLAVVRSSWYRNGKVIEVAQTIIEEGDGAVDAFGHCLRASLATGADVQVMTEYDPRHLGIEH